MKKNSEKIVFSIVLLFGIAAFIKNAVSYFATPASDTFMKQEYLVLMGEMPLGILLVFVPLVFKRWFSLKLPKAINLYYWFFIWLSVFMGTGFRLIANISFWDKILHTASPILLAALGYSIITTFLRKKEIPSFSPWVFLIFGFCFAETCGIFWEFWEFFCDTFLGMNLQRFATLEGVPYVGQKALLDTMGDLATNTFGAVLMTLFSLMAVKKNNDYFSGFILKKINKKEKIS